MEILRRLSEKCLSEQTKVYPVKDAARKVERGKSSDLQNNIITVNFTETPLLRDPNEAYFCVVVLTSNGRLGTITHLRTQANVKKFAQKLLQFHGEPTPVCLVGGEDVYSEALIRNLRLKLRDLGFVISTSTQNNDLGGQSIGRQATLFPDHVEVKHYDHSRQSFVNLTFPRQ